MNDAQPAMAFVPRFLRATLCAWIVTTFFYVMDNFPSRALTGAELVLAVIVFMALCLAASVVSGALAAAVVRERPLTMVVFSQLLALAAVALFLG